MVVMMSLLYSLTRMGSRLCMIVLVLGLAICNAWDINIVKSDIPGDVVQYSGYITVNGTYGMHHQIF